MNMAKEELSTMKNNQPKRLPCRQNIISKGKIQSDVESVKNDTSESSNQSSIICRRDIAVVRKGLGCRRSQKDLLSQEEQNQIESDCDRQKDSCIGRGQLPRKITRYSREMKPRRRLIFTSPRVISSDEDLFPSDRSSYMEPNNRWKKISEQAGSHRQDGTVMNIGRRPSNADAFRMGIVRCSAVRVRSLNLWVDHEKDTLLDWLEMISETFVNLEHLTLTQDLLPGEDDMAVSARMRRLYVLSVLPNLKSIDDMVVTQEEREMAAPASYNDQRMTSSDSKTPTNNPLCKDDSEGTDSKIMSMPVSIDDGSNRSSRASGIEVEFLAAKCWDVKQTETETTASISPTSNSEATLTATFSDDHPVVGRDEAFQVVSLFTDSMNGTPVLRVGEAFGDLRKDRDETGVKRLEQIIPSLDLADRSNEFNGCTSLSTKGNGQGKKVHALLSDSNTSIELVPVTTIDLEWSETSDIPTLGQRTSCASVIKLPRTFHEDTKRNVIGTTTLVKKDQNSTPMLKNEERINKGGDQEALVTIACTPVQRQSKVTVPTPQVGCCQILRNEQITISQFSFPTSSRPVPKIKSFSQGRIRSLGLSANQQLPPSKSLSSPFPMQFRERQKAPYIPTSSDKALNMPEQSTNHHPRDHSIFGHNEIEVVANSLSVITSLSSQQNKIYTPKTAEKGNFSAQCSLSKTRREVGSFSKTQELNSKNRNQQSSTIMSRESARAISAMDLDEE